MSAPTLKPTTVRLTCVMSAWSNLRDVNPSNVSTIGAGRGCVCPTKKRSPPMNLSIDTASVTIQKNEIRQKQFQDARVHFAIVCASSCPALRPEAYRSSVLDQQLDEAARAVLDDPSKNRWAPALRTLYFSERLEIAGAVPQEPIARRGTPTAAHEVGR
jgi:hypothetical protein